MTAARRNRPQYDDGEVAYDDDWGDVGQRFADSPGHQIPQAAAGDEVRWGNSRLFTIPRTGVDTAGTIPPQQLIQVNRNPKVWSVMLSVTLQNPGASPNFIPAADRLRVAFRISCGVGSAQILTYRTLDSGLGAVNMATLFPNDLPNMSSTVEGLPAGELLVQAIPFYSSAAATTDLIISVAASAAPIDREG